MGWASGLQAGIRLGETIRQGQLERELAEEAKKYKIGEVNPEQDNLNSAIDAAIRQKTGLSAGGESQAPIDTEVGLQSAARAARDVTPQYSFGGQSYADRQEAERAASLARTQGFADVYRSRGELEKASDLETRAQQQQAAGLQIRRGERQEAEDLAAINQRKEDAKWWQSRLVDKEGNQRAPTTEDFLAASQRTATSLLSAGKMSEAGAAFREFMTTAKGQIELQTAERTEALRGVFAAAAQNNDFEPAKEFYRKYVPNGANVKDLKVGKDGKITVEQVDLNGNKLPTSSFSKQEFLQALAGFNDPNKVLEYTQQSFMNNLRSRQVAADEARVDVARQQKNENTVQGKIKQIEAVLGRELSEDEKKVSLGLVTKERKLTEGEITSRARAMVDAGERNPDTRKPYTINEAVEFVRNGGVDPVAVALDKALTGGGDIFSDKAKTKAPPTGLVSPAQVPAAPSVNPRMGTGERNPFVDASGRATIPADYQSQGAPITRVVPAVTEAVQTGLSTAQSNYSAYLQSKIANQQPLTADETIRARRFGLIQ